MKILWVVNVPFLGLAELAGVQNPLSGGWLESALNSFIDKENFEIGVATTYNIEQIKFKKVNNIKYYLLPGGSPTRYNYNSQKNKKDWLKVLLDFSPNLVQIWGTEFSIGYTVLKLVNSIPNVVYIQGLLNPISKFYISGLSKTELIQCRTLKTFLFRKGIKNIQKHFFKCAKIESKILGLTHNIIGENIWCQEHCREIAPKAKYYFSHLPLHEDFFNKTWNIDKIERYTIFCNAGGYPLKGTHVLLKAIAIVKRVYPNVILKIPGMKSWKQLSLRYKQEGYLHFIHNLIINLGLESNILFLGPLTPREMADTISKAHVFVMPSCLENHSSSLLEALCVGAPCISSYVGGIPEYLSDNVNGKLYRFEEYQLLARYIIDLFSNDTICLKYSRNALLSIREERRNYLVFDELTKIYERILQ